MKNGKRQIVFLHFWEEKFLISRQKSAEVCFLIWRDLKFREKSNFKNQQQLILNFVVID